jgi:hypothetical protein
MTSHEILEGRIYMAEDAMYRRSDELNRHLHELESRLKGLTATVHQVLCETGETPLEEKSGTIVQAVEAFEAGTNLVEIKALAERVTSLAGLIEGFEREIAESAQTPAPSSEDHSVLQVLAMTGS